MGITASLGSFAGGLAGGFNTSENDQSLRAQKAAETDALAKETAHKQEQQAALREYGAQLKQWREGGSKGPAPVAPVGSADAGQIPTATAQPAAAQPATSGTPGTPAAPAVSPATMKVAQFLKAGGYDVLADHLAGGQPIQALQPAQSAASPNVGLTTRSIPYTTAPTPGPASGLTGSGGTDEFGS